MSAPAGRGVEPWTGEPDHMDPFVGFSSALGRLLVRCSAHIRVQGVEDLPPEVRRGPLIVASNHASNADPILIAAWVTPALGRTVHWLAKEEALHWPIAGPFMRANGAFGIRRGAADVDAIRAARRELDAGHVLGLFPEGTRSPTGALQRAKEGVTLLAVRTGAPVLPVGIAGSHRYWPKGGLVRPGARITVRVGRPFRLTAPRGGDHRAALEAATLELMRHVVALLPPDQRGFYAEETGA